MLRIAFSQEAHQFGIYFVRMCPGDAVRPILHYHQAGSLDQLGSAEARSSDGQNSIRIAVNDQSRYVDASQVLAEVLMPCWHASETGCGRGPGCHVPTGLNRLWANALAQEQIRVVEIGKKIGEERVTICDDSFLDSLEDTAVHALRVVGRLQQERRADEMNTALVTPFDPYFPK